MMNVRRKIAIVFALAIGLAAADAAAQTQALDPCSTAAHASALSADISGATVTLRWLPPHACTPSSYVIVAGSAPGLSDLAIVPTGSSQTSLTVHNVPPGLYYLRVFFEVGGVRSSFSNEIPVAVGLPCTLPSAPPGLGATATAATAHLTWSAAARATSYILEAGSATGLANLAVFDTGSSATSFATPAPQGTYYVRVRARNACGIGAASNEAVVAVAAPTALPPPDLPLELSGNQIVVIDTPTYTFRNRIVLRDSSMLIIRNSSFVAFAQYGNQYDLRAYDDAKVIIENSRVDSSFFVTWRFFDRALMQMTHAPNPHSALWLAFQDHTKATFTHVGQAFGTAAEGAEMYIYDARSSFIEHVFPTGAIADVRFPTTIAGEPHRFPSGNASGITYTITMAHVPSTKWGISYHPGTNITIRNTRSLGTTFGFLTGDSGLTARFDGLRAAHYGDQTWMTGNATLRLIDTTTLTWGFVAYGNNALIINDSEIADIEQVFDTASVHISDSTLTVAGTHGQARMTLERSYVFHGVAASDNSVITLTDTGVGGNIARVGNGQVVLNRVMTASRGFALSHLARLTARTGEVIAGRASIKAISEGEHEFNPIVNTDRTLIPLAAGRTYRVSFRYRILTPASQAFEVTFVSPSAFAAGVFLPNLRLTGAAGDSGTATLTNTLGPYNDYQVGWSVVGSGSILIDDIEIVDVGTGAVIGRENAETVLTGSSGDNSFRSQLGDGPNYSSRNTRIGSMSDARAAGISAPTIETATTIAITDAITSGSVGDTPNNMPSSSPTPRPRP